MVHGSSVAYRLVPDENGRVDPTEKTIVCAPGLWMIIQCIARKVGCPSRCWNFTLQSMLSVRLSFLLAGRINRKSIALVKDIGTHFIV